MPWISPGSSDSRRTVAPASSTALRGSVSSTCSTPSVARMATVLSWSLLLIPALLVDSRRGAAGPDRVPGPAWEICERQASASVLHQPAIHHKVLPGNRTRPWRGEEHDRIGELFRRGHPPQRSGLGDQVEYRRRRGGAGVGGAQ